MYVSTYHVAAAFAAIALSRTHFSIHDVNNSNLRTLGRGNSIGEIKGEMSLTCEISTGYSLSRCKKNSIIGNNNKDEGRRKCN